MGVQTKPGIELVRLLRRHRVPETGTISGQRGKRQRLDVAIAALYFDDDLKVGECP